MAQPDPDKASDVSPELQQMLSSIEARIKEERATISQDLLKCPEPEYFHTEFDKEAQNLLKNWMRVEVESEQIKQKVTHTKPGTGQFSSLAAARPKTAAKPKSKGRPVPAPDTVEDDMQLAYGLLDKYRKNRNMISEEIQEEKHKLDLIEDSGKPVVKTPAVDPLLAIELRHAKLEAKRKERIEKAATKPPENLKENRRSSEANRIRAECKPTKPAEVRTSISAGRKDQEFNEQIRELHDKRRVLEEDSKKIAEEVKMITESVKQQAEEYKQFDRAKRLQERELAEKRRLQEEEQRLRREREEAEQKYHEFRIVGMFSKLEQIVALQRRKSLRFGFSGIVRSNLELKTVEMKIECIVKYRTKSAVMGGWRRFANEERARREAKRYAKAKEAEEQRAKAAWEHFTKGRLRTVMREWTKATSAAREEKRIAEEHQKMQGQIEEFLTRMKQISEQKVREEEEEKKRKQLQVELEAKVAEEDNKQNRSAPESEKKDEDVSETEIPETCCCYENEEFEKEEPEESAPKTIKKKEIFQASPSADPRSPPEPAPVPPQAENEAPTADIISTQMRPTTQQQKKAPAQPAPKMVLDMEERARQRKEKREQLKKVYEEKQRAKEAEKAEQERKKAEEERKHKIELREKKRRDELAKKQKEEVAKKRAKELEDMNHKADSLRGKVRARNALRGMRQHVQAELCVGMQKIRRFHEGLIKRVMKGWLNAAMTERRQEEVFTGSQGRVADALLRKHLFSRYFRGWVKFYTVSFAEQTKLLERHERWSRLIALRGWRRVMPVLKKENAETLKAECELARRFRIRFWGTRAVKCLRRNVILSKEEKEKEQHKAELWGKVNGWLKQYDAMNVGK